jgi:hypothetical protein
MNNRHKYFRNLRYKQKLESRYDNRDYSWCRLSFVTNEPDPRYIREYAHKYQFRSKNDITYEEKVQNFLDDANKPFRGHDYYLYYDRPEVPYSIIEYKDRPYGKNKKFYKKYTTRILRHSKEVLPHNQYRKQFDLWWTID